MTGSSRFVARFYLVDRNTGELVHVYEAPAGFCFHNINAWEQDEGEQVMDCMCLLTQPSICDAVQGTVSSWTSQSTRMTLWSMIYF